MTAKEDKLNFISHYLEDWIPETKMSETIERLDEVIESYCREQPAKFNDSTSEPLPNAYLDNLIKRVEAKKETEPECDYHEGYNVGIKDAVFILRSAPVGVCEWKKIPFGEGHGVATGCGWALMDWDEKKEYVGCPYCLRKIKRI